jgi:para-nitrobenzyl esterase
MTHDPIAWDADGGAGERVRVDAPAGRISGLRRDDVALFRGIRYAESPTGPLRFAAPVDAARVEEIDATAWGPVSLQDLDPLPARIPGAEGYYYPPEITFSEDCLRLNVWTSERADADAPVLVWFHGGGFTWGSGTGPWVDGTRFAAEHGLVVVTVTYRLGLLGNLWLGDIDPTASDLGIQDQQSALRWVQRNIAAFGGDPGRVTLMGQSAGAMSVGAHLVSPASRGLFHGAAMISGHLGIAPSVADAVAFRKQVLEALRVDPARDVLAQLRTVSTTRIQAVQRSFGLVPGGFPLVRDGVVLPEEPVAAVGRGEGAPVPLLIGCDSEEMRLFSITDSLAPLPIDELLGGLLGDDEVLAREARALYAELGLDDVALSYVIQNDQAWASPIAALAEAHGAAGNAAYQYEFTRRSPVHAGVHDTEVGAAHLSELPFFWGNLDAPGVPDLLGDDVLTDPALRLLADRVSGTVARFVATGSPDGGPLGAWPASTPDARTTMVIGVEASAAQSDARARRVAFWRRQATAPVLAVLQD